MVKPDYSCPVTVEFDMDSRKTLSPLYFGDNLEHTRDCINSGLSAQRLKNRKFASQPQRNGCPMGWERIGGFLSIPWEHTYTRHYEGYFMKRSHESHDLVITGYDDSVCGIAQSGLYLKAGEGYEFAPASDIVATVNGGALAVKEEHMLKILLGAAYAAGITAVNDVGELVGQLYVLFLGDNTVFDNIDGNMGAYIADNIKIYIEAAVYLDNVLTPHDLTGSVLNKCNGAVKTVQLKELIELHCLARSNMVDNDTVYNAVYLHTSTSRSFIISAMRMKRPF